MNEFKDKNVGYKTTCNSVHKTENYVWGQSWHQVTSAWASSSFQDPQYFVAAWWWHYASHTVLALTQPLMILDTNATYSCVPPFCSALHLHEAHDPIVYISGVFINYVVNESLSSRWSVIYKNCQLPKKPVFAWKGCNCYVDQVHRKIVSRLLPMTRLRTVLFFGPCRT